MLVGGFCYSDTTPTKTHKESSVISLGDEIEFC